MNKEDAKSKEYATTMLTEHLHVIDSTIKMIDMNIEITERKYTKLLERLRQIKIRCELAMDHLGVLNVIEERDKAERQSAKERSERPETTETSPRDKLG